MARVAAARATGRRIILDSGAIIAWGRGSQAIRALIIVPVVVLAQVIRGGPLDAPINQVLKGINEFTAITPLLARQAGVLLGHTATTDVADALIAAEALRELPAIIITSDPDDLRRLVQSDPAHPRVQVVAI